jgi:hypothetical protein
MKKRLIIGIMGAAGAGKDSVGKILCEHHAMTRVAFADHLKALAIDQGWNGRKDEEGRRLLQDLGTEIRRKDPTYFIREAMRTMDRIDGAVCVTDVRYANEISTLEGLGAHLWWVHRPNVGPANEHVSEHEWRGCRDATLIMNDGTLDALRHVVGYQLRRVTG